jgi:exodeoxyribonuclease VII large subunit
MQQSALDLQPSRRLYTVSSLTKEIRELLGGAYDGIWVSGEISGLKLAASGHAYFALKDAEAQIKCACWKGNLRLLRFKPQEGLAVLARGRVDVYEPRGEYQLIVDVIEPQGAGALQLAFEQLKKKLEAEGLFAAERKRALPRYPRRIGIVTSPTGAAIQDMLNILSRRWPGLEIRLFPAVVQGTGAAEQVVEGIERLGGSGWPEVLIVGRGGGSIEDLWTFNEEAVARAIAACPVPVISAVGHETDFTIADFAADLRAPTPSAAAELATPEKAAVEEWIAAREERLSRALRHRLVRLARRYDDAQFRLRENVRRGPERLRRRLEAAVSRLQRRDPRLRLAEARRRLEALAQKLPPAVGRVAALKLARVERLSAALAQLSPLRVLERGYAIVQTKDGAAVRDASQVKKGEEVTARLHKGSLTAKVTG